jgi:hypothetical protein
LKSTPAFTGRARWRARQHRPAWWVGLVLAVLLAQGLGQWHRVVHGTPAGVVHSAPAGAVHSVPAGAVGGVAATADDRHPAEHGGLLGQHGEQECRLYDQLACADGLTLATAPLGLLAVHGAGLPVLASPPAWLSPRYTRPARAPPLA